MLFETPPLESTGWFFVKIGAIIGMALYVVFAVIVSKQVGIMTQTLEINFEKPLKLFSTLHLIASVFVFIYSILM